MIAVIVFASAPLHTTPSLPTRVRHFGKAKDLWTSPAQVDKGLREIPSDAAKVKALKDQINTYVKGFGWVEYKTPFSCHTDETIGAVVHLAAALKQIIHESRGREPPSEAKVPSTRTAKIGVLGTLTPETLEMKERGWSSEQLRTQFDAIRADLEAKRAAKAAKDAERHDGHALAQPDTAPMCNASLIGTHVEVLVQLQEEEEE